MNPMSAVAFFALVAVASCGVVAPAGLLGSPLVGGLAAPGLAYNGALLNPYAAGYAAPLAYNGALAYNGGLAYNGALAYNGGLAYNGYNAGLVSPYAAGYAAPYGYGAYGAYGAGLVAPYGYAGALAAPYSTLIKKK